MISNSAFAEFLGKQVGFAVRTVVGVQLVRTADSTRTLMRGAAVGRYFLDQLLELFDLEGFAEEAGEAFL
ncbi:MAG: hypothetical protein DHS20C16_37090 [Phycisphaerae bacterium]|nr:MAG: hypothetical protein DHS20C16_37090 [Phycisphaerae bacterium]